MLALIVFGASEACDKEMDVLENGRPIKPISPFSPSE